VSSSGISWAICKSASRSRQITTPVHHYWSFLQAECLSCCPPGSAPGPTLGNEYGKTLPYDGVWDKHNVICIQQATVIFITWFTAYTTLTSLLTEHPYQIYWTTKGEQPLTSSKTTYLDFPTASPSTHQDCMTLMTFHSTPNPASL